MNSKATSSASHSDLAAVCFDLDGTLLDSLPGIEYAVDRALAECGYPGRQCPMRPLIGPPIRAILARVTGEEDPERTRALEQAFRTAYDSGDWPRSRPQPGASELLTEIGERGIPAFLVTNKPQAATHRILRFLRWDGYFGETVSRDSRTPAFASKSEMLSALTARHALTPRLSLMVGDTAEDAVAAEAAGFRVLLVANGYGDRVAFPRCECIASLWDLVGVLRT